MELLLGNCLDRLKELKDNSVDAIVTDPPYGLSFMGKKWDYDVPQVEVWKECLRVLKPGGYLLSFAGTRTQHRMAVNIEDAGFEIRDMIMYVYGSGFPKSLNIFKQLKKRCTCGNMEAYEQGRNVQGVSSEQEAKHSMRPVSEADLSQAVSNQKTEGKVLQQSLSEQSLPTSLLQLPSKVRKGQPSLERGSNIQESKGELQGSDIPEVSKGISADGEERRIHNATQVGNGSTLEQTIGEGGGSTSPRPQSQQQQYREPCAFCKQYGTQAMGTLGLGSALKPACEPITVARKPISEKNLAENCLKWGVGGINIDGCRVETEDYLQRDCKGFNSSTCYEHGGYGDKALKGLRGSTTGRFPANLIHDGSEEVVGCFPDTKSGKMGPQHTRHTDGSPNGIYGKFDVNHELGETYGDSGNASRFFMSCKYTPKDAIMNICEDSIYVNNVGNSLPIMSLIESVVNISSVLKSATPNLDLLNHYLNVLFVEKKSESIVIDFVAKLVAISEVPEGVLNQQELTVIQDFITSCKGCSQTQNPVSSVGKREDTDITQIIINLLRLCGYVLLATEENTNSGKREVGVVNGEPKRFLYCSKASKRERNIGCEGLEETYKKRIWAQSELSKTDFGNQENKHPTTNFHPTVKPIALMEYLVKLVSREGQVVLDPFMGSGTTGMACKKLNRDFIGIEMMPEYMEIAKCRIKGVKKSEQLNMI